MLRSIVLTIALALVPAGALASSCPSVMAEIDAAMASASLSETDMARVKELRAEGEALHAAGDHAGSEAALKEAKALLGL
jgi:hypothetical protein